MFFGRHEEIRQLIQLTNKRVASLVVIKGRRRIGKSSLINEFGKNFGKYHRFEGLAPQKNTTNADQLKTFAEQFSRNFALPTVAFHSWSEAFENLAKQVKSGRTLVLLDEISWMGSRDAKFPGLLKQAWDMYLKQNDKLILVLCGSVSSWIEDNILNHTQFVGRVSLVIRLQELELNEVGKFWGSRFERLNRKEILEILSVTGGIPKYLEEVDSRESADQNIKRLCYQQGGYLFEDFDRIFSDIFGRRSKSYLKIIRGLMKDKMTATELATRVKMPSNGIFLGYLRDLQESGFIARSENYNLVTGAAGLARYRISDNYLRFYLKYIEPFKEQITKELFKFNKLADLISWPTIAGFQFENLILNRIPAIIQAMNLGNEAIVSAEPYVQRQTAKRPGCQIDLLIVCKRALIYPCEIKFQDEIKPSVVREMEAKLSRMKLPKNTAVRPVLMYAGELAPEVLEADYFDRILDLGTMLE